MPQLRRGGRRAGRDAKAVGRFSADISRSRRPSVRPPPPPAGALLFPFGCRMMDEDAHSHSLAGGVTNTGCARPLAPSSSSSVRSGRRKGGRQRRLVSSPPPIPISILPPPTRQKPLRRRRGTKEGDGKLWEKGPFRGALAVTRNGRVHLVLDGKTNYTLKEARSQSVDGLLRA